MLTLSSRSTNCWLEPRVIVAPTTAQQVAAALALCNFFRTKFSVRGGGHLHNPGFNSNNGGVVITLGKFKQVNLSDDRTTADIGLGLTWLDVYKALDRDGLAVTGGRVPTVGIPGLILGGGISFQNSRYGVGAMGVTNYEVCPYIQSIRRPSMSTTTRLSSQTQALSTPMRTKTQTYSGRSREAVPISVSSHSPPAVGHLTPYRNRDQNRDGYNSQQNLDPGHSLSTHRIRPAHESPYAVP